MNRFLRRKLNRFVHRLKRYLTVHAGRITTTELVNRIFIFCELYSGKKLFPYQEQFSKRVIRSVLENDGEEITALFSRQSGKSETISVTSGGMMIILPLLANMPMFADDPRLSLFKDGLWIGIFAPSQRQASITYNRIKSRIQCPTAIAVLESPEFNIEFTTSNGQTVRLSNGSFATAISASEGSNIEGESFKLIICEECFVRGTKVLTLNGEKPIEEVKVGDFVYSYNHNTGSIELKPVVRSFSQPLYGRKLVTVRSKSGKSFTCTDNHPVYIEGKGYTRADNLHIGDLMLSYTYATQGGICNGFKSDDFRFTNGGRFHCISRQEILEESEVCDKSIRETGRICLGKVPSNSGFVYSRAKDSNKSRLRKQFMSSSDSLFTCNKMVLRSLLYKGCEDCNTEMARFDERRSPCLLVHGRRFHERNDVYSYSRIFSGGKSTNSRLVEEPIWNKTNNPIRQQMWKTLPVFQGDRKKQVSTVDTSLYSGLYEIQNTYNRCRKTLCNVRKNDSTLSVKKNRDMSGMQGFIQERVLQELLSKDEIREIEIREVSEVEVFDLTVEDNHNFFAEGCLVHNCQDISNFKIRKSIHPMGAAYNASIIKIGTATTFKGDFYEAIQRNKREAEIRSTHRKNHFEYDYTVASKYNPSYAKYVQKEMKRLGENSDEFRMAYKLEWVIERGMFVDITKFEENNVEPLLERSFYDKNATHVVGIDLGGKGDDTVVTVVEVCWNVPAILESTINPETNEEEVYQAYNCYIKDWFRISNEPDYEVQYALIVDYLSHFNISKVLCDATREAGLSHRLRANMPFEVIPYIFTTKSKSELYKHLDREITSGRARVPGGKQTIESSEYKDFLSQLGDLQKGYSGVNLVVSHPDEKGAHDDFPDSWALAVLGCSEPGSVNTVQTSNSPFNKYGKKDSHRALQQCNRVRARRRR